ncbi:hypothetical protein DFH28DRAFT_1069189 [Melampsora americana]|nr:hypothetical protein DFH28DRAFT_1069189 [Melampsora americana]
MEVHRTINGTNTPITPPPTQPPAASQRTTANDKKKGPCEGVDGVFAEGHNKRKNAGCKNNACIECCYLVNQSAGCVPHTGLQNKKRKEAIAGKKASNAHLVHVDPALSDYTTDTTRETQKVIPNYAQGSHYRAFRSISLQDQADERTNNAALQLANQTISLIVWAPDSQATGISPDLWRVVAPLWPRFALDQCNLLVEMAEFKLGTSWNRNVRVWNDTEQIWALTHISTMDTYPVAFRKVLVMLPGISVSNCEDVERQIASVTTRTTKDRMKLNRYITPTNSNCNIIFIDGSPTPSPANDNRRITELNSTPIATSRKRKEIDEDVAMDQEEASTDQPNISDDMATDRETTPTANRGWPEGVKMTAMLDFFVGYRGSVSMAAAWKHIFGNTYAKYSSTTVSNYRKWLDEIGPSTLKAFVQTQGHITVAEARKNHFQKEWKDSCSRNTVTVETPSKKKAKM